MGIDAAINRVAEEIRLSSRVISDEFRLLNLELRAGKARADALRNLGARTDVEEVRSFATLLIQTDRFGTSVAQALRVHSDAMRTRRYQKAEELAAKLPVKLMFPLILFIFPAIFVVIVGPAAIQIYQQIIASTRRHSMDKTLRILMIAAIALLFVSVNSCSLINYFSGYVKSWESKAPGRATLGDGMERFIGSVRAPLGNPDAHYLLGDYYQGRGRHRDAIEEFNKAIRIDPRFREGLQRDRRVAGPDRGA